MRNAILGAIAGAAGTMALDVTSYGDMALRGRQSSNTPAEVVRRLAEKAGIEPLAKPDDAADAATKNRRSALGALSGYSIGIAIGAFYGVARPYMKWLPLPLAAVAVGALAMAAADTPATRLGATDPSTWGAAGWIADIVPHVAFGVATVAVAEAIAQANGD